MAKDNTETLSIKDIYNEIGANYRFFLNWRHALFAGYLATCIAFASVYGKIIELKSTNLTWVIFFLIGLILTLCFWGLEIRIQSLYRACTNTGSLIEKSFHQVGIYIELDGENMRNKKITHTLVLNCLYGIVSLCLVIMLIISVCRMFT